MAGMLQRVTLLSLFFPLGVGSYWLLSDLQETEAGAEVATRAGLSGSFGGALGIRSAAGTRSGGDPDHNLSLLSILERDLFIVKQRYVEKDRLDPQAMFDAALEAVEREISEVMFVRAPGGDRLHISVGAYSTILPLQPIPDLDALYSQLRSVALILDENLSTEIDRASVEYTLINGALSTLDPHSLLLPPVAAKEMEVDNQGEFGGLGIEIVSEDGQLTIKQPMPDTPAAKAGLKADDQIVRIEDESTINMDLDDAVQRLRGEPGTKVNIEVQREGAAKPIPFAITRAVIRVNPVEGELLEGNVGYIQLKTFHANVASDLDDMLTRFKRESGGELRGLVLDLRSNPGGYLNQAIEVADTFLDDGVIVTTVEGSERRRDETRAKRDGNEPDYPIVVLVNGSSASASEIVAGALRNQNRAVIVGERSFGKGSVQHLYNNRDDSRLKLTVAQYLTPGDRSIQSVGIAPDVLLQPSVVRPASAGGVGSDGMPTVSLYWREWLDREADLDHHLQNAATALEEDVTYKLRYLRSDTEDTQSDPRVDWEVRLARELLLSSAGSRRVEVLQSVAPLIKRYQSDQDAALQAAFRSIGVDWTAPAPTDITPDAAPAAAEVAPDLTVRLDLGKDGVLVAGQDEVIALEVTNNGPTPLYQVSAVTDSENVALAHREFYFGRLNPGETRRFERKVSLPYGHGEAFTPVEINFRDSASDDLLTATSLVSTVGRDLPRLGYEITLRDDGSGHSRGDGDGIPEVGETIDLMMTIWNEGEGETREAYARLKNRSGRNLDLQRGVIEIGKPVTDSGAPCDAVSASASASASASVSAASCSRVLKPGEKHQESFTFKVRDLPQGGSWNLELLVGDNRAYDYTTVSAGGFYDYFQMDERIELQPGQPLPATVRHAPVISVTRTPELQTKDGQAVISGVVQDDRGVRDVMIFHGEDKVFFRGGNEGSETLPFTVDQGLQPGLNRVYILARDYQGLTATYSISTWYGEDTPEKLAARRQ